MAILTPRQAVLGGVSALALLGMPSLLAVALVPDRPLGIMRMVSAGSAADVAEMFRRAGFDPARARRLAALEVPPVFLSGLPSDLAQVDDLDKRKMLFVSVVLPHVLQANERLRLDRARIERLRDEAGLVHGLARRDRRWLETIAERYGAPSQDFDEILRRVDIVPPRLAVAQAVQESGWGTSRFAQHGNALFGQHAPTGEDTMAARKASVSLRAFDSLHESVIGYMHNLNTHRAYRHFRSARERMREAGMPVDATKLVDTLAGYSEEGRKYVHRLEAIMAQPEVSIARGARLNRDGSP